MDFEQSTMNCPRCDKEYEDFDGVGVIYCAPNGCGFCRHVACSGRFDGSWVCDYCGEVEPFAAPSVTPLGLATGAG